MEIVVKKIPNNKCSFFIHMLSCSHPLLQIVGGLMCCGAFDIIIIMNLTCFPCERVHKEKSYVNLVNIPLHPPSKDGSFLGLFDELPFGCRWER
jgi:hypothetical protein